MQHQSRNQTSLSSRQPCWTSSTQQLWHHMFSFQIGIAGWENLFQVWEVIKLEVIWFQAVFVLHVSWSGQGKLVSPAEYLYKPSTTDIKHFHAISMFFLQKLSEEYENLGKWLNNFSEHKRPIAHRIGNDTRWKRPQNAFIPGWERAGASL